MKKPALVLISILQAIVLQASAQQGTPPSMNLENALKQATEVSTSPSLLSENKKPEGSAQPALPFTTDTQIRVLNLFEQATNRDILRPADSKPKGKDTYLSVENVPLNSLFKLLARRSGLNYLEPDNDVPGLEEKISLEMTEPKPRTLMDWLLKHRNLELYDAGTGIYTIRQYTNQLSFYKFKLKDNFIDRFKGSANGSSGTGGGTGGYGGYSGGGGNAGNAVSANSSSITVENGGKYGEIEALLEKVGTGDEKEKCKAYYYPEKQTVLLYGTRAASERVAQYIEIANERNPNIRIDVRIYATGNNPESHMGVDWSKMLSPGLTFGLQPPGTGISGGSGTNGSTFPSFNSLQSIGESFGHPLSSIVLKNDIQATLNMFVKDNKAEAITEPSTVTANDREVAFAATTEIPYVGGSSVAGGGYGGGSSFGTGYDQTSFVSVGANINILPRIQSGNRLKLGTAISISQLDQFITISAGTAGSPPRQVPQTSGRAYSGEFTIASGDTIVIAGMKTHNVSKSINKVPWIGDVPGLGKLFRNTDSNKQNNYMTIFITATILDGDNNPTIPVGQLQPKDNYPNDDSVLTAEPNVNSLLHAHPMNDRAIINARREALQVRTEQANKIIAKRLEQEERMSRIGTDISSKEEEIKGLETQRKQTKGSDSSIQAVRQEIEVKLERAKGEREALLKEMKVCQEGLSKLTTEEVKAKKEVEKAEADYSDALKHADPKAPSSASAQDAKPAAQPAGDNLLKQNESLLQGL